MNHEELGMAVEAYRLMVYRIAYGYTGNAEDAEDITQDVFLKLYQSTIAFMDSEHKKAWLIRVTINKSKNLIKSAWRRKRSDFPENLTYYTPVRDSELIDCVMRLKIIYRTVVYLFYYEGYSVREIAKILQISEGAVKTRLNRAREQLKKILIREDDSFYGEIERLYQKNV